MTMLEIRHALEEHLRTVDCNVHGGGTNLETGVMDVTFDHDGQDYKLTLDEFRAPPEG